MNLKNNITLTILTFLLFPCIGSAQIFIGELSIDDDTQVHILELNNGDKVIGKIISIENTTVKFENNASLKVQKFELFEIQKITSLDKIENANLEEQSKYEEKKEMKKLNTFPSMPIGSHRLFYSETGFCLPQGTSEYQTIYGLAHLFDFGLSDNITLGTGITYPGYIMLHLKFNYISGYLHPKLRAGFDFQIAGKPQRAFNPFEGKEEVGWNGFFRINTYFSYGTPDRNVYLGFTLMPIFEPFDSFDSGIISFNFGGTVRIAPKWKIIYENVFGFLDNNIGVTGFFSGLGVNYFNAKNSFKVALHPTPNFPFFSFPIGELNQVAALPFFSYSRYF